MLHVISLKICNSHKDKAVHAMKVIRGSGCSVLLLTPALDGGVWSASRHGRFTPKGITY